MSAKNWPKNVSTICFEPLGCQATGNVREKAVQTL
jgi:hypothetical protein